MTELFSAALVAVFAFLGTNLENLLVLVGLMAASGVKPRVVGFGYLLSIVTVIGVSLGLGAMLGQMDPQHLRWLGLVPLGFGLFLGGRTILRKSGRELAAPHQVLAFWSAFGVSLAHSMDSLLVFGPLFAETKTGDLLVMVVTMGLLAVGAVFLSGYLATHPRMGRRLQRISTVVVPLLLIAVGIYILSDTPTDL